MALRSILSLHVHWVVILKVCPCSQQVLDEEWLHLLTVYSTFPQPFTFLKQSIIIWNQNYMNLYLHGHGHYDMASISSLRNEGFMTFMIHVGVVLAKSHHTLADVPFPAQTTIQLLAVVRYKAPALLPQFTIRPKSYLSFTTSKNLPSLQRLHLSPALSASGRSCLLSPFLSFHKCWH